MQEQFQKQIKNNTNKQNSLWTNTNDPNKQVNNQISKKQSHISPKQANRQTKCKMDKHEQFEQTGKEVFLGQERTIPTQTDRQTNAPWTSRDNLNKPLFTLCFTIIFCR